jgi:tetratricopeptide (TPR) repeat protein
MSTRRITTTLSILALLSLLFAATGAQAFWSHEKSEEEKSADNKKDALKKYNGGVEHMEKAREIGAKGDSAYAYNYRATSDKKARGEFESAVEDFKRATEIKPDFKEAWNNLGYCYRKLGELQPSLSAYDRAIALDSTFAQAREYRGETFLSLGLLDMALKELAVLRDQESPYADTLMASIELYRLREIDNKLKSPSNDQ